LPSLWQHPTAVGALGLEATAPVRCACGRTVPADMMTDGRTLPPELLPDHGQALFCDACRETLHRTGRLLPAELAQLLGAPPEVVAMHRAAHAGYGRAAAQAEHDGRAPHLRQTRRIP